MKNLRFLLILFIVIIAVWQISPHFRDFGEVYRLRSKINYLWLALAILSQSGQYLGDGWLSKILLKITGTNISFINTLKIASMNVFAANLLPVGQAGALTTAFYFYKKLGVTNQNFIFLSLCWTAITTIVLILIFIVSLITIGEIPHLGFSYKIIGAAIFIGIFSIGVLAIISKTILWPRLRYAFERSKPYKEFILFKKNIPNFKTAIFQNKTSFYASLLAAFIFYLSSISTLIFSFFTFGLYIPFPLAALAYTLSLVAGWITLAPAGIGATEAALILIFLQFNLPPAETVAAILLFRIISFWIPIPAGLVSFISLKRASIGKKA